MLSETDVGSKESELFLTDRLVGKKYDECGFNVHTTSEGLTERIFSFLAENSQACAEWISLISTAASVAKKNAVPHYRNYQVNALCLFQTLPRASHFKQLFVVVKLSPL